MKHLVLVVFVLFPLLSAFAADRPNILWLTCEDMSPDLGCYGDTYARTPHIDRLAARGIRFTRAFAESPMCAPSRSALISGMHTGPLGTSQMRSAHPIPTAYRGFPAWLRDQTPGPHRQERCPPRQPVANDARRHGRESARQISRRRSRRHHQGNRRMTMSSNPIPAKGRLHRFRVLRWSSAALLAFLFFLGAAQAAERPNIVIFLADDLGYGSVGYQGGKPKTPTLDTLAKESVRFTDFYTGMCNCSPSRASLLTGRSATRVGLYNWRPRASRMVLRGSEVTLAELLRGAGYRTGVFGKWHLGEVTPLEGVLTPVDHGFEHSFVTDLNAEPSHHNPVDFIRNGVAVGESQGYSCQIVVDEALRVLETVKLGESFFHYIPFHEPHVPLASPEELVKGYPDATKEEAVYYANVENMDRAIGRYLAALKTRGLSGNTLVLFASDNGPTGPGSSRGGLRAGKDALYDGGIKVPALLSWPSRIPKPRTISEPVALVDVMPTLCETQGYMI